MQTTLILAGDISKGYADFVLLEAVNRKLLQNRFRLDDTGEGHQVLRNHLIDWQQSKRASRILLVVESTGGYEDNWLRLAEDPILGSFLEAYRINPKITHHEYRTQQRSSVDDGISALTIGLHVCKNLDSFVPTTTVDQADFKAARSLIKHIISLEKQSSAHKSSLLKLLYQYLPSLLSLKSDNWPNYFLGILIRYGGRQSILRAARRGFTALKHVPQGVAIKVVDTLVNGVGAKQTPPLVILTIKSKARQIRQLQQEIADMEAHLLQIAPVDQVQVDLLCSIKGMGAVAATKLLCFIEDYTRFKSANQLAAFFGVQPRVKSSGDGVYGSRMSKQGSSVVRRELYLTAFRTLQNVPYLRALYRKQRKKGMVHDAALGVLMHKIVRIIYGMLKSNLAFDAGVDQLNQVDQRLLQSQQSAAASAPLTKAESGVHRFQQPSSQAPISRRKKRELRAPTSPQGSSAESSQPTLK